MFADTPSALSHTSLPSSRDLKAAMPLSDALQTQIRKQRAAIAEILAGRDDRMLVVVGPCSVHDPVAALDYAQRLASLNQHLSDRLLLVMRVYVEKPRTITGWKGLAYDPHLDGSHDMSEGLRQARELMIDIASLGLPVSTELLSPVVTHYLDDILSWAAIGARTTESQIHRELVSGLDFPVGFKNATSGSVQIAADAMQSAAHAHHSFGVDGHGVMSRMLTQGNPHTHLVLRGGDQGPNFDAASVASAQHCLTQSGAPAALMVDCSHANSGKDPARQPDVLAHVVSQRVRGNKALCAVMLESFIEEGKQPITANGLRYGQSVTDGCLGWAHTEQLLRQMATALAASNTELAF
ncbi:3-deoxy-7-phosphoheptulonate synthase [Larsenimonas salina]|uniref:3-deoxy-7-phosphoheptulonate synthase n=1 Tax=Larsenimonas salina TaxID=1295565 RepID=UPI0020744108|nr:3-deoxy-7-phosphoheptulonate synthase [Larsenimonas salina]MCM5704137.1 3-deoxy-7-phosphoheptulonate synthase [Larsenimonas salina]